MCVQDRFRLAFTAGGAPTFMSGAAQDAGVLKEQSGQQADEQEDDVNNYGTKRQPARGKAGVLNYDKPRQCTAN